MSSSSYVIVWFACFMFIEIPGAASNVAVPYETPACAAVATLRTSSVNEQDDCFLFPFTIMATFGANDAVTTRCANGGIGKTAHITWKLKFKAPYSHSSHIPIGRFEDWHSPTWYKALICPILVPKLCQKSIDTPKKFSRPSKRRCCRMP